VILDLTRSHLHGEHLLSKAATANAFGLVAILATISSGPAMVTMPVPAILLDAVVVSFLIAALHGEIREYVDWRSARDPAYKPIKQKLFGTR
jgi:hypothetical protein